MSQGIQNSPVVFLSYAHSDDVADDGNISSFAQELRKAYKTVTGRDLALFQDRTSIELGYVWEDAINLAIKWSTFLLPIITPSYFASAPCMNELRTFLQNEKRFGRVDLILPIYWRDTPLLESPDTTTEEGRLANILGRRQRRDWRVHRAKRQTDPEIKAALEVVAAEIQKAFEGRAPTLAQRALEQPVISTYSELEGRPARRTLPPATTHGRLSPAELWQYSYARRTLASLLLALFHGRVAKDDADNIDGGSAKKKTIRYTLPQILRGLNRFGCSATDETVKLFMRRMHDRVLAGDVFYNAAADFIINTIDEDPEWRNTVAIREQLEQWDILSLYQHLSGQKPLSEHDFKILRRPLDGSSYQSVAGAVRLVFNVDLAEANDCVLSFLQTNEEGRYVDTAFLCYRYATTPGSVVKSYLVVNPPAEGAQPLASFTVYYENKDRGVRSATGFVIPHRRAIYFVGNMGEPRPDGIYVLVLLNPDVGTRNRLRFRGLVLSMNSDLEPIVCRVGLRRAKALPREQVKTGVFDEAEMANRLKYDIENEWLLQGDIGGEVKNLRQQMRNEVARRYVDRIINKKGEIIAHDGVRDIVASALHLAEEPLLRIQQMDMAEQSLQPFNPLGDGALPCNAALSLNIRRQWS